ncbi:hypothetical protein [Sphingomonas sp. Leaf242]|uniref:hypothetical protein n=1 Tax=Sphingomonas sp. Leaf242 TaxID=1736304 RepID=UPI000715858C|nr:hypothetical protein [Sphingomonas sp. Leaf242]KQO08930.1 hypothetical protein ASF09_04280 [Sphingomonas sp. Leaf242]
MIEITPAIMGPGIEEEYADALAAIADLRRALGDRQLTNDTPDGRVLLEVGWIEQEIRRQRLPIPVDASYAGTIYYLVGSNELLHVSGVLDPAGIKNALGRLYRVLQGIGLVKPRHVPVLIAMIDDLCGDADKVRDRLNAEEREVIDDIRAQGVLLKRGEWPPYRQPQDRFFRYEAPNLNSLDLNFGNRAAGISASLFDGWRPYPSKKPPLAAPVPGLYRRHRPCRRNLTADFPKL